MFTGIVEEVGTVESVREVGDGRALRIAARVVLEGIRLGDSISVDGACHTVVDFGPESFDIQSVRTTLERTTVGEFAPGRKVNLERALAFGERLGGHLVQGHVDGVGEVLSVVARGEHVLIDFSVPPLVEEVTILHGSVALNGVSLTVNALPTPGTAQVSIIPHTWAVTNLGGLRASDRVNLEGDLIGKYVRQLTQPRNGEAARQARGAGQHVTPDAV